MNSVGAPSFRPANGNLAGSRLGEVRELCRSTLERNWRSGVGPGDGTHFGYTRPSPRHYPFQWYWDSCFAAIAWRHFDQARAQAELKSLLAAQREDGFIGHTIFWDTPLNERQRLTYNLTAPEAPMTASIQPPALAWAWRIAVGDPARVPGIARHCDWLAEYRDLDRDGLLWIVQPDESGLDASPQFDSAWRARAHGLPAFVLLVHRNRRLGYDLRRIVADGGPVCCEVLTNVLHSLSLMALGRPSLTSVIVERMYDEQLGLFLTVVRLEPRRPPSITWAALAPQALPDLPDEIGHRLVQEHLLDPEQFWVPVPPASVSVGDPSFSRKDTMLGIRRYWRGPTWINAAWLIWLGLRRLGYIAHAEVLRDRVGGAVAAAGLREYYDPYSGRGMGAVDFAWSALIMELLQPDPRQSSSYV